MKLPFRALLVYAINEISCGTGRLPTRRVTFVKHSVAGRFRIEATYLPAFTKDPYFLFLDSRTTNDFVWLTQLLMQSKDPNHDLFTISGTLHSKSKFLQDPESFMLNVLTNFTAVMKCVPTRLRSMFTPKDLYGELAVNYLVKATVFASNELTRKFGEPGTSDVWGASAVVIDDELLTAALSGDEERRKMDLERVETFMVQSKPEAYELVLGFIYASDVAQVLIATAFSPKQIWEGMIYGGLGRPIEALKPPRKDTKAESPKVSNPPETRRTIDLTQGLLGLTRRVRRSNKDTEGTEEGEGQ
jgi:hypothetical protein